jgi:hypothetical protein
MAVVEDGLERDEILRRVVDDEDLDAFHRGLPMQPAAEDRQQLFAVHRLGR